MALLQAREEAAMDLAHSAAADATAAKDGEEREGGDERIARPDVCGM